jgi:hypothetical protein
MMAGAGGLWSALRGHLNVWRIQQHPDPSPIAGAVIGIAFGLMLVKASRVSVARYGLGPLAGARLPPPAGAADGPGVLDAGAGLLAGRGDPVQGCPDAGRGRGLSSVIFALMHIGQFPRYLPWTASALVAGFGFALLYRWSGDLTGPVLAHFLVNYLNLRRLGHRG